MTPANLAGQFGDTTYTKVFVGGLAWETQKETMKKYFEQFGEILEAVVITDKATGRSKGYGFVTFREPEAAMRACVDAAPVIDGRRANCNLASLGVQRSKPSTPKNGGGGGGGGGGGVVVREPEEAVGGENEEAGFEEREVRDVVAFEVDGREDGTLDFVWEKDGSTAACEVCFWEIVCCH